MGTKKIRILIAIVIGTCIGAWLATVVPQRIVKIIAMRHMESPNETRVQQGIVYNATPIEIPVE